MVHIGFHAWTPVMALIYIDICTETINDIDIKTRCE